MFLQTIQGAEYEVLDDSQEHWWKVKDENGYYIIFFVLNNYKHWFTNYFTFFFFPLTIDDLTLRHNLLTSLSHTYTSRWHQSTDNREK